MTATLSVVDRHGHPVHVCERHGLEHRTAKWNDAACIGHSKRAGNKCCTRYPAEGQRVCAAHGARTPQARGAAAKRKGEELLAGSIAELIHRHRPDLDQVDPTVALLEVVADTWAMRRALWGLVGELTAEGAPGYELGRRGQTEDGRLVLEWVPADPSSLWGPDHKGDAKPHVLVGMLHAATEEHLKACKYAVDAGIEERRVRLAESTAEVIAGVLRAMAAGVLATLGRLGGDQVLVRGVEGELPGLMRAALDGARVTDVSSEETS